MEVIDRLRNQFTIRMMCSHLGVTRQGFDAWRKRPESKRSKDNRRLLGEIRNASKESRDTYGSPRIHAELKAKGETVSLNRIARLMAANNIVGRVKRKSYKLRLQAKETMPAPNHLSRNFRPGTLNQAWASDITYLRTNEGWVFLSVVIDLYSRMVVGWSMDKIQDTKLISNSLTMALKRRNVSSNLMHHSDQGCQYTSLSFRQLLSANNIKCSMSRRGNCWDNACVESFFGTLKQEMFFGKIWRKRKDLEAAVYEYIEVFYNRKRRHSTLGFVSPLEFEQNTIKAGVN